MEALFHRASTPQSFDDPAVREEILATACAVTRKYRYDVYKEDCDMEFDLNNMDRDGLFGCLLAVLEKVERDTYDKTETREPNAIRLQSIYCRRPLQVFRQLNEHLNQAYFPKLNPGLRSYYREKIGNIVGHIENKIENDSKISWNDPLKENYLIGYWLMRKELYTKKEKSNQDEEEH